MKTVFFNLSQDEIEELDQDRFNDDAEEELQQEVWTQKHTTIIKSKLGEIIVTLQ